LSTLYRALVCAGRVEISALLIKLEWCIVNICEADIYKMVTAL
jgi:hypothetical protein